MTHFLEIRLLGPFEALAGGRPANVGGGKRQGLLALLALRCDHVVDVDLLIDALWGDELPASPRNAVQHHIARLRSALGQQSIVASPDGYTLTNAGVDALRFEELLRDGRGALQVGDPGAAAESVAAALELWRGRALHGLTDTAWFSAEARRLESLRVDALEEQFEAALALGEHRDVVAAVRAALEDNPFRERLWGQLMLALYRSSRQADALDAFSEARRVLSAELALEPGPDLRRLQEAILTHDPAIAPVRGAPARRGNLPASSTSFVGRDEELGQVAELLGEHRLVTLTGPPGVGKSRLAVEVARSLEPEAGAWRVDLARAGSPDDVVRLVAAAVDARGADPLERAIFRLREGGAAVLLLDACEPVLGEAARVAAAVLDQCPDVRVLATSREVLHVPGEARFAVEPLGLPPADAPDVPSAAVQLFVERARAARPRFELTPGALEMVTDICRLVDGLPLAIEFAAARLNVLGLAELLRVVERRLALLRERPAADAARTALSALVEWSYDLLQEEEKSLLHKVAVHRGGASLPSLVALGASIGLDEARVTYLLGVLGDKSILSVSFPDEGGARYDVLDTVREYALERLAETGRLDAARRAHAEYFAKLADETREQLRGREWRLWVDRLELEHDNLWAALAYARDVRDTDIAARLASLAWYFTVAARVTEGRRFVELALAEAPDDSSDRRLDALTVLCFLATEEFDPDAAIEIGERALALATTRTDTRQVGLAQATLALAVAAAGDIERGTTLAEQARASLEGGQDHWAFTVASLLRAQIAVAVGDASTVAAMAADAHRHAEAIGFDAFRLPAMLLDAWVAIQRDDGDAATHAYRRALDLAGDAGFADHVAFALSGLGSCALARGDLQHAEEFQRRALATAKGARAAWAAAHARVELGRILALAGDTDTASRLYRTVLEWSKRPRPHGPRESLFVALAEDPGVAAAAELAALGDATAVPAAAVAPI